MTQESSNLHNSRRFSKGWSFGFGADNIEATYDNGILVITLPKVVETKPKRIKISVK